MKRIGSQIRETLEEAGYKLVRREIRAVVLEGPDGQRELWHANDKAASYTIQVGRWAYEFGRTLKERGIDLTRDCNSPAFTRAYITCALWSSTDDAGEPLDKNYSMDDIAEETLRKMIADCEEFQKANRRSLDMLGGREEQHGHDFWLSRNGHGAGFFDREVRGVMQETARDFLQKAAQKFGNVDLYVGNDKKIYA